MKNENRKTIIFNEDENKEDDKKRILILLYIQEITDSISRITNIN